MSLLASAAEVPTLTTIAAVVGFAGLETPVWDRLSASLGGPRELRILAMMPAEVMQKAIRDLRIVSGPPPSDGDPSPTREPNATETIQLALVWRVARQVMGLVDVDPMVTNATSTSIPGGGFPAGTGASVPGVVAGVPAPAGATTPSVKKVKISSVLDQTDDTEVEIKSRAELAGYFENHREITGSDPLPEVEPTDIQVVAMEEKVVVRDEAPYADFSILTPFGRRMQKTMKMKSFAFQPDGTWKTAEIPGPPNLQAWQACFKVYRAVLFMLRYPTGTTTAAPAATGPVGLVTRAPLVVQPHSLEQYFEAFMELCLEYPECWHLLMPAEDRMRGERFEHLRRGLARSHAAGKVPVEINYDPARPWDGVFQAAALDHHYWDSNVRRPAVAYLARSKSIPQPSLEPISDGAKESLRNVEKALGAEPSGSEPKKGKKRRRSGKKKRSRADSADSESKESKKAKKELRDKRNSREHPKKWGGLFHSTQDGKPICYAFAKGKRRQEIGAWPQCGPGHCRKGPATTCPASRRSREAKRRSRARSCKKIQILGTVRRAWWLHWGRPTEVWRRRGDDAGARLLVHRVGHSHRRALRGSKGVGRECRPHSLCTPVQINDEGPPCRQAWQGPSYSERQASGRMGTSKSNRRKPHSGTTHNPYGWCVEKWRNVLGGEPVGFILVDAPSDGAIHEEVSVDLSRSMFLWVRVQETHSYTYSCGMDEASLWHLPGSRRAQASTRRPVGEDAGFLPRPTSGSLENGVGRGIPSPSVLVVGRCFGGIHGKARGQGEPLETDDDEERRQQVGQERSAGCGRAPEWAREERIGRTRKLWEDCETHIRQLEDCQGWQSWERE